MDASPLLIVFSGPPRPCVLSFCIVVVGAPAASLCVSAWKTHGEKEPPSFHTNPHTHTRMPTLFKQKNDRDTRDKGRQKEKLIEIKRRKASCISYSRTPSFPPSLPPSLPRYCDTCNRRLKAWRSWSLAAASNLP